MLGEEIMKYTQTLKKFSIILLFFFLIQIGKGGSPIRDVLAKVDSEITNNEVNIHKSVLYNSDNTPPRIDFKSLKVNQKIASPGDTVVVSIKATDDLSGISHVYINLIHENGAQESIDSSAPDNEGFYNFRIKIGENMQSGKWTLNSVQSSDKVGNSVDYWSRETDLSKGDFEVKNSNADNTAPRIDFKSLKVNQKIASPGDTIVVSIKATDDLSGISHVYINLIHENGAQESIDSSSPDNEGYYNFRIKIGENMQSGKWILNSVQSSDKVGNSVDYWSRETDLSKGDFEVTDQIICDINFETSMGSSVPEIRQVVGTTISKPKNPTLNRYHFAGWYVDDKFSKSWDFEKMKLKESMTLYAKWISEEIYEVVAGINRYDTAAKISKSSYEKSETVILASGVNYPDALAGGPLAYLLNAPILLTKQDSIPDETLVEIIRLKSSKVVILGSDAAISKEVTRILTDFGIQVERIAGDSRYTTAIEVAKHVQKISGKSKRAILVSGMDFADALSAGSYASKENMPVLLTNPNLLLESLREALIESGVEEVILVGGSSAVSLGLEKEIKALGIRVERYFGLDRYHTGSVIAENFYKDASKVVVANGLTFPDAIAAVPMAAKLNAPIVLSGNSTVNNTVLTYLRESNVKYARFIGGDKAVPESVRMKIASVIE